MLAIRSSKKTVKVKGLKKVKTVKVSSLNKHLSLKVTGFNMKSKKFGKSYKLVPGKYLESQGVRESWLPNVSGNYVNGNSVKIQASILAEDLNEHSDDISYRYVADKDLTFKVNGLVDPDTVDISAIENLANKQAEKDRKKKEPFSLEPGALKTIYLKNLGYEEIFIINLMVVMTYM